MKLLPTRSVSPLKTFMPMYEPPWYWRIAPPIGLAVKPLTDATKNRRPVLYPISLNGDTRTTSAAAKATYAPDENPKSIENTIMPALLDAGIQRARERTPAR
jgi:hypothetical protein